MADKIEKVRLRDGTLVQHKVSGYRGRIDGTTGIKICFTSKGAALAGPATKEIFQYRVVVAGEMMRHIAPAEDLEILEEEQKTKILCFSCHSTFVSKPGELNKAGGRCDCGGWICPACLACQAPIEESLNAGESRCANQRRRLIRKQARRKKSNSVQTEVDTK
ncbi:MAG: hypothetical protein ACREQ7_17400 [Candidatus Binatia bacterium]